MSFPEISKHSKFAKRKCLFNVSGQCLINFVVSSILVRPKRSISAREDLFENK